MKILFLSRWFPYPPDNGSKIRVFNLLRQLSSEHTVDLIAFAGEPVTEEQRAALGCCRKAQSVPYRPFSPRRARALLGFFSATPRSVIDTYSAEMQRLAEEAARAEHYDLVIASQIDMAPYAAGLPAQARLFEEVELSTPYEQYASQQDRIKRLRAGLTWNKLAHYLPRLLSHFNGCTVVSEKERQLLAWVAPGGPRSEVVPNGVDLASLSGEFGEPQPGTLLYNGALTYSANFDAVNYFLREIFPKVKAKCPDAHLYVTGKTEGVPLERLPGREGVVFTGYLADVRPLVASAWASVVPLRQGGGTRLKILESLALGTPVVATSKGAEGLNLRPGEDFLLADSPEEFTAAVVRLLDDPALRAKLSAAGRERAALFDWNNTGVKLNRYIDSLFV